ncbi:hypothetical protein AC578_2955 [Pseudocercospora eumusae]|uniref:Uncharacterized protein n=1 Tax=Pseudocercospora eumusae TaxID=321146 RepID=A0A139HE77_9PEZI|nr:hypothetical protein AC578_2955 [Pseudocercospora eumusae]
MSERMEKFSKQNFLQKYCAGQRFLAARRSTMEELPFSSLDDDFCTSISAPNAVVKKRPGFLDLPGELRNKIYALALGGQEIHINVKPVHDKERTALILAARLPKAQRYGRTLYQRFRLVPPENRTRCDWIRFRRTVCDCSHNFATEYEHIKLVEGGEQKTTKKPFTTYSAEHASCMERFQGRNQDHYREMRRHRNSRLSLNLLATCRKVYEEAAFVPFACNTFSFDSVQDFQDFVVLALDERQVSLLTTVHIFDGLKFHDYDTPLWNQLKQETLDLVTALKELRLTIELESRIRMTKVATRAKPKQPGLSVKVMFDYKNKAAEEAHTFAATARWEIEEILSKGADALDYGWVLSPRMPGE